MPITRLNTRRRQYRPVLTAGRCYLKEALAILGVSKATFYREFRPPLVDDQSTVEGSQQSRERRLGPAYGPALRIFYVLRFDIREEVIAGTETLTLDRAQVTAHAEAVRSAAHGELAIGRSRRQERLGWCAKQGYGSRVRKDGTPREPRAARRRGPAEPLV